MNEHKPSDEQMNADTLGASHAVSATQRDLIQDVVRGALLANEREDRIRLRDALPEVIVSLDEAYEGIRSSLEAREKALSLIWPANVLLSELNPPHEKPHFPDVKSFWFANNSCGRRTTAKKDLVAFSASYEEQEKERRLNDGFDSEVDEESLEVVKTFRRELFLLSAKVAVLFSTDIGRFCDDNYDAKMEGEILLSENPKQMQAFTRESVRELRGFSSNNELEDVLKALFKADYEPAPLSQRLKP